MYLIIKTKRTVNAEDVTLSRDLLMSAFSKEYIGGIKKVVRDVDDYCLTDYGYAHNGITKGKLFIPAVDYNTIRIYFDNDEIEPMELNMSADKEYTLYNNDGFMIDTLSPYGYIINEIPCYDDKEER